VRRSCVPGPGASLVELFTIEWLVDPGRSSGLQLDSWSLSMRIVGQSSALRAIPSFRRMLVDNNCDEAAVWLLSSLLRYSK